MRLFYSPTSPYVRKVQVTAIEKDLGEHLTLIPCNAYAPAPELWAANPLGRVPTLVLDDGTALFDSPVICDWLEGQPQAWTGGPDLGQIAIACALGYLDFRLPELGWGRTRPSLSAWYAGFAQRESFRTTVPQPPPA